MWTKGIVTLTGNVRLTVERVQAQDALLGVRRIQRIVNNITVAQAVSSQGFEAQDEGS